MSGMVLALLRGHIEPLARKNDVGMRIFNKIVSVIVVVFAFGNGVFAKELTGGVKIGVGFSGVRGRDLQQTGEFFGTRSWVTLGGFLTYRLSSVFAIQPELLFTRK